jgi:hypothetical protein
MTKMNLTEIMQAIKQKGYTVYEQPFELNIVGIRKNSNISNRFDDSITVFYKNREGNWQWFSWPATTDPGTYWLKNPDAPKGTAILKSGQYRNAYIIGLHRGKYTALVQRGPNPVTVMRDYNRDNVLDFNTGKEQTGYFGINIHHASVNGTTKTIDRYSAGCQVFANISDFNVFMTLVQRHKTLYGNKFTYTLIDERQAALDEKKKDCS